ncbi:MAG: NAD(P)-dependent alcohol dehydrogenase [Rhodobacteraceae bacterium]|nr:NAD(P)-dependent alcohol dehydrogenase [Paracoccaceae bacterium]
MKAVIYRRYGPPEVMQCVDLPRPEPAPGEVLVRVRATALNGSDYEILTGWPIYSRMWGWIRPKIGALGSDIAGVVEAVGQGVTAFSPGDAVMGDVFEKWGGLAEYACLPADLLIAKPAALSFEQAAAIPQSGLIALQAIGGDGKVGPGDDVLIVGAGGGGGVFAIQIAKMLGATVTAVDSAEKADLMRELGADRVIDFRKQDYTALPHRYDVILDFVSARPFFASRRTLKPGGRYMMVGAGLGRAMLGGIGGPLLSRFSDRWAGMFLWRRNTAELAEVTQLVASGQIRAVIERCWPLDEAAAAMAHLGAGRALGKVVVTMDG